LILKKLAITEDSMIALNVLAINLEKRMEILLAFLRTCYAFFWSMRTDKAIAL
jgi:hypothetical protein